MSDREKALFLVVLVAFLSAGNGPVQKIGILVIPPHNPPCFAPKS